MTRPAQGLLSQGEALVLYPTQGGYRGPTAADLLAPYREQGTVRMTAYERFYTWTTGSLQWRLITINARMEAEVVGRPFESRTEALLAMPALARVHGCVKSR